MNIQEIRDSFRLLRFQFSLFLLPVSLFSFYFIKPPACLELLLVLLIWHILVYPSSNGYNSYHDMDEGPIGGLEAPPKPSLTLLRLCNLMDLGAVGLAFLVNARFALFVALYILSSRLYSNRSIRLKKFPVTSFLIVTVFQGFWIFAANIYAFESSFLFADDDVIISGLACSFFIATIYPITQIYQHEQDERDGILTLSMVLGARGTFVFSGMMFLIATWLVFLAFCEKPEYENNFVFFNIAMLPCTAYFIHWACRSFRDSQQVNFHNAMRMLVLCSIFINLYFLFILFKQ